LGEEAINIAQRPHKAFYSFLMVMCSLGIMARVLGLYQLARTSN